MMMNNMEYLLLNEHLINLNLVMKLLNQLVMMNVWMLVVVLYVVFVVVVGLEDYA